MAQTIKEELNIEEFEIKAEKVSFKEEILPSSTAEDTFTVNLHKDEKQMENTGIQGGHDSFFYIFIIVHCYGLRSMDFYLLCLGTFSKKQPT